MEYNTQLRELTLPEYGRNVHSMVEYCKTLPTKEERTKCANAIIDIMGNMFPHLRDVNDFKHILWDHIAIMSDFELDIDYPYEIIKKEDLHSRPEPLPYSRPTMRYRHYGKTLESMIKLALTLENGEEKEQLTLLIATHMKKSYIQWNKEVDDLKIFVDLFELSEGQIDLRASKIRLPEMKEVNQRTNNQNNAGGGSRRRRR